VAEGAREKLRRLINARTTREIVFTRNTTESLNLVARCFRFGPDAVVLTTDHEHNSNLCPWRELEKRGIARHVAVPSRPDNTFDLDRFRDLLVRHDVRLVSMVHTSNLDGSTIPAKEIVRLAHERGVRVMLDAAQSVPHSPVDVRELDVDFLAFSVHKMCGPTGMGVLYGKEEALGELGPFIVGGDTVTDTFLDSDPVYADPPYRFEAGLQNFAGIIGAGAAADYLMAVGPGNVHEHEQRLNRFVTGGLTDLRDEFDILGPEDPDLRGSIVCLLSRRKGTVSLSRATFLREAGRVPDSADAGAGGREQAVYGLDDLLDNWGNVMVRSGVFCVHSWFHSRNLNVACELRRRLGTERQTVRLSFYLYNTMDECRVFLELLHRIVRLPEYRSLPLA
jgi:cysteine desulfurase/selenocysteine lyase